MDYFVRKVELETGEQVPFVYSKNPAQPVLLGNMFLVTWLRSQVSQNTVLDAARLIKYLYQWADLTCTDLEGRLMAGQMLNLTEIVSFMTWLSNKRRDAPIVGSIGTQVEGMDDDRGDYNDDYLSPSRYNTYKDEFHGFLKWAAQTFVAKAYPDAAVAVDALFKDMVAQLKGIFKRITIRGKSVRRGKGLTKEQRQRLLDVAKPGSPQNPFRKEIQLRNYLIVLVFLYTGMRRGELCSVWVEDTPTKANRYAMRIQRRPDDPRDTRKRKPKIKGRSREILLTENIAQMIQDYIKKYRWSVIVRDETGKVIKREKPDHDYLFGQPADGAGRCQRRVALLCRGLRHLTGSGGQAGFQDASGGHAAPHLGPASSRHGAGQSVFHGGVRRLGSR